MTTFIREVAMVEWPQERQRRLGSMVQVSQRLADIPNDLVREIRTTSEFDELVQAAIDAFSRRQDPEVALGNLSTRIDRSEAFGGYDEIVRHAILAMAGVEALRSIPSREMWEYLWSLAWHSSALERYLPEAVIAACDDGFRDQFFEIAKRVVAEAIENPGRRAIERERSVGASRREHWRDRPQLSALWGGRFEHSFHAVGRDDDHVLLIVAEIDVAKFVHLLALYDYPDPVAHALVWCGAQWRFERWRAVTLAAPEAFDDRAGWNQSLILPLLLEIAREQFQFGLGNNPTPEQVADATDEIRDLAAEVAKTLSQRSDAQGCATRWGNWLVRTSVPAVSTNPIPHPSDAASHGFIDDALLEALISEMPGNRWKAELPPDVEAWEPWCQLAVGAMVALAGKTSMPSPGKFLDEWHVSLDQWSARYGGGLLLAAIPFELTTQRADGYGARLLAIPLVETDSPDELWERFWSSTISLREIVEFGDVDEADPNGWQGRIDAGRLLMLQFSIGLMMLDHLIMPLRALPYERSSVIVNLLPRLNEAIREMAAIDQLNGRFWSESIRHLAIRRAAWLSNNDASIGITISADATPNLSDFIRALAGDTENLLALACVAQQNHVDKAVIAKAFVEAEINLQAEIELAERLLSISPRAIGLDRAQIDTAREIARSDLPSQH
ncbi:hypothetical protein OEJ37_04370 [Burkholderia sp. BKH01]|uniref:hypothetical protein n=1 Tax=Burkholderia sp. BKH01 TaxID=2769262 RepID=UPI0021E02456|nr:hypothetical protein [Burkholderia sp. BKH01]MCU9952596.1 hypothetical protein [Burkholderia sp. BKH01]